MVQVVERKMVADLPAEEQQKYYPPGVRVVPLADLEYLHASKKAVIVGGGASLATADVEALLADPEVVTVGVNGTAARAAWDYLCVFDRPAWSHIRGWCLPRHIVAPSAYPWYLSQDGTWDLTKTWTFAATRFFAYPNVPTPEVFKGPKLWRRKTIFMAISLAVVLGCTEFDLLGVDMGGPHWNGDPGEEDPRREEARWRFEREAISQIGYYLLMSGYRLGPAWAAKCPHPVIHCPPEKRVTKLISM